MSVLIQRRERQQTVAGRTIAQHHTQLRSAKQQQMLDEQEGSESLLVHARWCLLKRTENLSERQASKLKELLRYNLRSV